MLFDLRRLEFFILLSFFFLVQHGSAQSIVTLNDPGKTFRLDASVGVFIDTTNALTFDQISSDKFQTNFTFERKALTFGYLPSTIWLKIQSRSTQVDKQWMLEIPAPFLEYVDFYQLTSAGHYEHSLAGYYRNQSAKKISHTAHVLPLIFTNDSISTVFVKITGQSPKTFPVYAIEKERFYAKVREEDVGYGFFFGILAVMFFFNFFIYLTLKQTNYLLYICTIVCTFLILSSASGYAGKFLWPEYAALNYFAGRLMLPVLTIFLSIFTIRFMEVQKYSKFLYYILISFIPLAVIAFLLIVTKTMSSAGNNLISLSTIVYIATGIVCHVKGNKTAKYFIVAWTAYIVGGLLLTLRNSGFLDFNFWTTHLVEIGAALETTIIGFALGDRYRRYKQEKEEIQLLAFHAQQEATEKLEVKVRERTEELSRTNEELFSTLETNKLQTKIIEEKNAELDAFFYRISHDLKGPINTLLGLSNVAVQDVSDPKAQLYLGQQRTQVERLNNIISGLIDLTKVSDSELRKERIDFPKLIHDCISTYSSHERFSKIDFQIKVEAGIEYYSEWTLLNAIVQNLVENAIKYSLGEKPFVKLEISKAENCITLAISDNGQGIPRDQQDRIFDIFYRATQKAEGSGLGLYILKRSVQRLKGSIEVYSEPDKGSKFVVSLPTE
jgi:signal transduction histidine kinase